MIGRKYSFEPCAFPLGPKLSCTQIFNRIISIPPITSGNYDADKSWRYDTMPINCAVL